jgi:acyl-CoA thioesterase I
MTAFKKQKTRDTMARGIIASLLGAFVMSCTGCGGGSGSPRTQQAQQTLQAPPKPVLLEVYGDSTAAGCTPTPGAQAIQPCHTAGFAVANPSPEQTLQSLLQAKYGSTVTVVNRGVAGNTAPALLTGDGLNLPWAQQMAQSKAQDIVLIFGINDSHVSVNEPVDTFQSNMSGLIRIAKAAGKTVLVETPNPVTDPSSASLRSYAAASIAAARMWDANVIDEFGFLSAQPAWDSMLSDGVHPTQGGYNLKAQFEFTALDPIVRNARVN